MLGGAIGDFAGKMFKPLTGHGDYSESGLDTSANSLVEPMTASQVPLFDSPEHLHGAVRVRHREYFRKVFTSSDDAFDYFRINPANTTMFPWLSTLALNFEQWIPTGMVFEFVSTCGNAFAANNAALGDVSMATLYDIEAPALTDRSEVLNHFYSTSAATSQNLMHAIECAPGDTPCMPRYIQAPLAGDERLNDLGVLTVMTGGSQALYTAGQLWVTYEIILLKPRLQGLIGSNCVPKYTARTLARLAEEHPDLPKKFISQLATETVPVKEQSEEKEVFDELADWAVANPPPPFVATDPKGSNSSESTLESLKKAVAKFRDEALNPREP